jgi:hypothetical protein
VPRRGAERAVAEHEIAALDDLEGGAFRRAQNR